MAASVSEDELKQVQSSLQQQVADLTSSTINGYHLDANQELAAATHLGEDFKISDQKVDAKSSFDCPHCDKSYTTKKSLSVRYALIHILYMLTTLQRHLSNADNTCAKQRHVQAPSKLRWACSRCGKDCATIHSVEVSRAVNTATRD